MGRRSNFERLDKDKYDTVDPRAVPPLLPHLDDDHYVELCAGKGCLIDALTRLGLTCTYACDIAPDGIGIEEKDALAVTTVKHRIITNPPWKRKLLHPLITHFRMMADTWLLFDAGWMFTEQAAPYLKYCHKIVVVPRLQWFLGSDFDAQDDCAWYNFKAEEAPAGGPVLINERGKK